MYPIYEHVLTRESRQTLGKILDLIARKRWTLDPSFQGSWDDARKSECIESLLMRIPPPVLYCAEQEDGRFQVENDRNWIQTLVQFHQDELSLVQMADPDYNGQTFQTLSQGDQERILNTGQSICLLQREKGVPKDAHEIRLAHIRGR